MKKRVTMCAVSVMLLLLLSGCGGGQASAIKCAKAVDSALEKVEIKAIDTTVGYEEETYEDNFQRLYNFSMDQVDDGVIAYASDGGNADEISVVHVKDSNDVSSVKKYMEARLNKRLQDFQSYKPEEVGKIENGKVVVQEQYVILVISNKADDIISAIRELLS